MMNADLEVNNHHWSNSVNKHARETTAKSRRICFRNRERTDLLMGLSRNGKKGKLLVEESGDWRGELDIGEGEA
jgi:hypothetical protein